MKGFDNMKKILLVSVLLGGLMVGYSQQSQPTELNALKYCIDYDNRVVKVEFGDIFKEDKTAACEQRMEQSQPTEHYVLKYYIDYDNKVLKVRFSDDFKGNKTIACEQLMEMKNITDYSVNIYK